ncbi:hypothetical protein ANCCAN_17763 [Ancylostoma caninum]|uniref:Protein kinase domain-containing protein n=1 Tax=Ancylostoma caninum TaxID=29170 RepID=A0A368FW64_ANCCA|nr:hypothetical protein ANCCAN_17763 [Ancylostoma caninum]
MCSLRISFDSVVCGYKRRLKKGSIVAREWRIVQKLGEGGFGSVYKVVNVETRTYAAFKVEAPREHSVLKLEAKFGFIHRDLKPANVAVGPVGTPQFRFLHIFDFGLAREYIVMPRTGPPKMRRPRPRAHFRGTLRYCSVNTHQKGEQGRDDDLWCLLYMLVELRGPLPWAKVR